MNSYIYRSFDGYVPNQTYSFGKDLVDGVVGLEKNESTGKIKLDTYGLDLVENNYCPICGGKLSN